ncbi:MAG: hypothetical protein Fur0018_19520 [Anaerolineales bacterium]
MNVASWFGVLGLLGVALLMWMPRYGLLALWRQVRMQRWRVWQEDTLKHLYQFEEVEQTPTLQSLAGMLAVSLDQAAAIADDLAAHDLLTITPDAALTLTPAGREYALQVVRAHRLWERYLADETGYEQTVWHRKAEAQEHRLTPEEANALASRLGYPRYDPHGDPIPTARGEIVSLARQPLNSLLPDQHARIVHLEDEPAQIYEQLTQAGLHVGMDIRITENAPQGIRFESGGQPHRLSHTQAGCVSVSLTAQPPVVESGLRPLSAVPLGHGASLKRISPACQGPERRRLLDLGFVPGTRLRVAMQSPGGADLRAYEVRGSLIALRQNQSDLLLVEDEPQTTGA